MIVKTARSGLLACALISAPLALAHGEAARPIKAQFQKAQLQSEAPARLDAQTAIQKANAYLNGSETFVADFVQIAADGKKSEGKLYVQRPGKLRFEYARPATLEIIADGVTLAIRDKKLATQDLLFIKQTPLKFLLKENVDLSKDVKVLSVDSNPKTVIISVEDKVTFGGTSKIKLAFDAKSFALKQWQVTDPQGFETLVTLSNVDYSQKPDADLFVIEKERFLNPN